jgi:hypothetical protein
MNEKNKVTWFNNRFLDISDVVNNTKLSVGIDACYDELNNTTYQKINIKIQNTTSKHMNFDIDVGDMDLIYNWLTSVRENNYDVSKCKEFKLVKFKINIVKKLSIVMIEKEKMKYCVLSIIEGDIKFDVVMNTIQSKNFFECINQLKNTYTIILSNMYTVINNYKNTKLLQDNFLQIISELNSNISNIRMLIEDNKIKETVNKSYIKEDTEPEKEYEEPRVHIISKNDNNQNKFEDFLSTIDVDSINLEKPNEIKIKEQMPTLDVRPVLDNIIDKHVFKDLYSWISAFSTLSKKSSDITMFNIVKTLTSNAYKNIGFELKDSFEFYTCQFLLRNDLLSFLKLDKFEMMKYIETPITGYVSLYKYENDIYINIKEFVVDIFILNILNNITNTRLKLLSSINIDKYPLEYISSVYLVKRLTYMFLAGFSKEYLNNIQEEAKNVFELLLNRKDSIITNYNDFYTDLTKGAQLNINMESFVKMSELIIKKIEQINPDDLNNIEFNKQLNSNEDIKILSFENEETEDVENSISIAPVDITNKEKIKKRDGFDIDDSEDTFESIFNAITGGE